MAKNLRAKIPASDTLVIRDLDSNIMQKFVDEIRASHSTPGEPLKIELAANPREVAEKSVSPVPLPVADIASSSRRGMVRVPSSSFTPFLCCSTGLCIPKSSPRGNI